MSGRATIELIVGDITRVPADAIVNAANSSLAGGGGVDGAIHRAGGPAVMADLERRYGRRRHCPTGQAAIGDAGALPARWVIHAVGPIWRGGTAGEPALLANAYRNSLRLAAEHGARSITFPAISCGAYGYPLEQAARIALDTVRETLDARPDQPLERVTFVLFSRDTYDVFEKVALRGGAGSQ